MHSGVPIEPEIVRIAAGIEGKDKRWLMDAVVPDYSFGEIAKLIDSTDKADIKKFKDVGYAALDRLKIESRYRRWTRFIERFG